MSQYRWRLDRAMIVPAAAGAIFVGLTMTASAERTAPSTGTPPQTISGIADGGAAFQLAVLHMPNQSNGGSSGNGGGSSGNSGGNPPGRHHNPPGHGGGSSGNGGGSSGHQGHGHHPPGHGGPGGGHGCGNFVSCH